MQEAMLAGYTDGEKGSEILWNSLIRDFVMAQKVFKRV